MSLPRNACLGAFLIMFLPSLCAAQDCKVVPRAASNLRDIFYNGTFVGQYHVARCTLPGRETSECHTYRASDEDDKPLGTVLLMNDYIYTDGYPYQNRVGIAQNPCQVMQLLRGQAPAAQQEQVRPASHRRDELPLAIVGENRRSFTLPSSFHCRVDAGRIWVNSAPLGSTSDNTIGASLAGGGYVQLGTLERLDGYMNVYRVFPSRRLVAAVRDVCEAFFILVETIYWDRDPELFPWTDKPW